MGVLTILNVAFIAVALGLIWQRRRDLGRLRAFVYGVNPLPATERDIVLDLTRRCYLLPEIRRNASFCPRLFAPLGATPSAVLRLGDCCSGRSRLLILALHERGIPAHQITLYHRAGQAQHCLVEARLLDQRLIVDPSYGIYYQGPDREPISLTDLQRGVSPTWVPLVDDGKCGYPAIDYYDFEFRASKTANWTKSGIRRAAYRLLYRVTRGGVDRLQVPALLEWPQYLFIGFASACVLSANVVVMTIAGL